MELLDSHMHLNDEPFRGKEEYYLKRAKQLNVVSGVVAGQDAEFNRRAIEFICDCWLLPRCGY